MEKERTLNWFMDMLAICKTELGLKFNSEDDAHVKNIFQSLKAPYLVKVLEPHGNPDYNRGFRDCQADMLANAAPDARMITWHELKRGGRTNLFFATPLAYYEIGDDGFMFSPWVCKYPDVETAKTAAQKDFSHKLHFILHGTGSLEDVPKWKDSIMGIKIGTEHEQN